jgi:hypothetical protein
MDKREKGTVPSGASPRAQTGLSPFCDSSSIAIDLQLRQEAPGNASALFPLSLWERGRVRVRVFIPIALP